MIKSSTINVLSQKTDTIGLNVDFAPIVQSQIGGNMSSDILHSDDSTLNVWFLNDDIFLSETNIDNIYCDRLLFNNDYNQSKSDVLKSKVLSTEDFKEQNRIKFLNLIEVTQFEAGEDNYATEAMAILIDKNRDATLTLLQEYFVGAMEHETLNETLMVKILSMLSDYSYEELCPFSQAIALMAYGIKSIRVESAVFNLFGHWGNCESLNMLRK